MLNNIGNYIQIYTEDIKNKRSYALRLFLFEISGCNPMPF